jgi:cation:H+ antiporter
VLRKELPLLTGVTALAAWQARDGELGRGDASVLLGVFLLLMAWTVRQGLRNRSDALAGDMTTALAGGEKPLRRSLLQLAGGLLLLVGSSRLLVWGAVGIARGFGMSDLLIGLTIVAVGTSLPECASSVIAARRGEHELALGNILGSNLFNTLAVVGLAGAVSPLAAAREVFTRDIPAMALLTVSLFVIGYGFRGPGRINRWEGAALLAAYVGYMLLLATGSRS